MEKKEMNGEKYMSPFVGKVCVYNLICQFEQLNGYAQNRCKTWKGEKTTGSWKQKRLLLIPVFNLGRLMTCWQKRRRRRKRSGGELSCLSDDGGGGGNQFETGSSLHYWGGGPDWTEEKNGRFSKIVFVREFSPCCVWHRRLHFALMVKSLPQPTEHSITTGRNHYSFLMARAAKDFELLQKPFSQTEKLFNSAA